ncbi:MAG: hypothetical protein KC910_04345 [Candidatus Eremiobacteraeota bacterium]|nr:hypothetical protein [Candidatus Eremiobacteraeota bacterium]
MVNGRSLAEIFLANWRRAAFHTVVTLALLALAVGLATRWYAQRLTNLLVGYQTDGIGAELLAQLRTDPQVDLGHLAYLLQQLPAEGEGLWRLNQADEEREIVLESLTLDTPDELLDLETSLVRVQQLLWSCRVAHPGLEQLELVLPKKGQEVVVLTGQGQPGLPATDRLPHLAAIGRAARFAQTAPSQPGQRVYVVRAEGEPVGELRVRLSRREAAAVARRQSQFLAWLGGLSGLAVALVMLALGRQLRASTRQQVERPLAELSQLLRGVDQDGDGHIGLRDTELALPELRHFSQRLKAAKEIAHITAAARQHLELLSTTLGENEAIQEELRQALLRLEEASRVLMQASKGWTLAELGAWVAHDLNNKLQGAFSISSSWLKRDKPCPVKHLTHLHASLEKAIEQIEQFRNLAGPSGADRVEQVEARGLIEDLRLLVAQRLEQAGAGLAIEVEEGLVYRDLSPGKFQDMLLNLLLNACDAIAEKEGPGTVKVEAKGTQLVVADDGVGMDEDTRGQLFGRPFFTTKGSRGSGLGLRIVASVVNELGGGIECESSPGRGTTFTISLGADHVVAP